jgi:(p)ppGpp synthase/HD superfamily hydrolase
MKKFIDNAKDYAFKKHNMPSDSQWYGSLPYSKHLLDVLSNADRYIHYIAEDKREIVRCACLLHDTIEDTDTGPSDLEKMFNHEVADLVLRVSNERGWDRKERNFKTYPKIWVNDLAIFVKLCDRMANTRNSKETGHTMYEVYRKEYPVFRYALKVRNLYPDMWAEMDELNKK